MVTCGNRDCQLASTSALMDFTDDTLTISAAVYSKMDLPECRMHAGNGEYNVAVDGT